VPLFVNSTDVNNGIEWLPEWLEAHGSPAPTRPRELRECTNTPLP